MISIVLPFVRWKKAFRCMDAVRENAGPVEYEIVAEEDVDRIGCPKMVKKLVERTKYDWVVFLGDDTIPQKGFLINAFKASKLLPDGWGLVGLNDRIHDGKQLATHWMCHKNMLYFLEGEFFHTGYIHCECDRELVARAKQLKRYIFAHDAIVIHDHPITWRGGAEPDEDYKRVYDDKVTRRDRKLFWTRSQNGWKTPDDFLDTTEVRP